MNRAGSVRRFCRCTKRYDGKGRCSGLAAKLLGVAGLAALALAAALTGALASGDRIRAAYAQEPAEERPARRRLSLFFLVAGIMLLAAYGVLTGALSQPLKP